MKSVIIYTSTDCENCHGAMEFLKENNIQYTEFNISKDKEAKKAIMKKGYMSVPLIMVDDKVLIGFDRKELSIALNL